MEERGTLKSWNDDKGFGFIRPDRGGEDVFVHISAVRGEQRPSVGQTVMFVSGRDARGRLRAEHMRGEALARDRPAIRRKPPQPGVRAPVRPTGGGAAGAGVRNLSAKLGLFALLCLLPLCGALTLWRHSGLLWPLLAYPLLSVVSFALYWQDKHRAQTRSWRTPEKTLHVIELLGGWPGALIAQQVFRHKTRKLSFQLVFWVIVVAHQVFWLDWLFLDAQLFGLLRRIAV